MKRANLAGIEAKIQRASNTLDALDAEVAAFFSKNYRVEGRSVPAERKYAFYAYGPATLPLAFAVVAGEIVHHLRSSLDHLVTELAALGPGGGKAHKLEFPLCATAALFDEARKRGKIAGVSAVAADLIERVQPYHWDPPEQSTLMVLHKLDVVDKHRTPLVVAAAPRMTSSLSVNTSGQDVTVIGMSPPVSAEMRPSPDGTEVFAIEFKESHALPPRIDGVFPFALMLNGPTIELPSDLPLIGVLRHARDAVLGLIGAFFMAAPDGSLIERDTMATVTKGNPIEL